MAVVTSADIVFCLDASATMESWLVEVRNHLGDLVGSIQDDKHPSWSIRWDFLAYNTPYDYGNGKKTFRTDKKHDGQQGMRLQSVSKKNFQLLDALYRSDQENSASQSSFFTDDVEAFKSAFQKIECVGDETPAVALDMAADFPFRDATSCHRVVILITDEPMEKGSAVARSNERLADLQQKLREKRIVLYLITPQSDAFDMLSQTEKSEWMILSSKDLATPDFGEMFQRIRNSIYSLKPAPPAMQGVRPLFNEDLWTDGGNCVCTDLTDAIEGGATGLSEDVEFQKV